MVNPTYEDKLEPPSEHEQSLAGREAVKARIILFTRYPISGKAKTRLLPSFSPIEAAQLQRSMTELMVAVLRQVQQQVPVEIEIRFTGYDRRKMQQWLGQEFSYIPQGEGDLGDRLSRAFQAGFGQGCTRIIALGSDCPQLGLEGLTAALASLEHTDLVLGPATDGGYYLIGLRQAVPALFQGIAWSTASVLTETLEIGQQQGLTVTQLPVLGDIDRPEDLTLWIQHQLQIATPPTLSVIIPTFNEATVLAETLAQLKLAPMPLEIVVCDGGSTDATVAIAQSQGVKVCSAPRGRAQQMNQGAAESTGDILLFLHADSQLPPNFRQEAIVTLAKPGVVAGAFHLAIAGEAWGLRWVEWGTNLRSAWGQLPYGDQGLFLLRPTFESLGGFPALPIMEDFCLIQQLRKRGRIALAPSAVTTSGRRWSRLGIIKTTLMNQCVIAGYYAGISPDRLAQWYRG